MSKRISLILWLMVSTLVFAFLATGCASTRTEYLQADDLKVDVFGVVGIATFTLDYSFLVGDQTIRRRDRSTLVFVKDGEEWKIVHEHLSPVTLADPGGSANESRR